MKKKFALIGWQIKNSASAFIHNTIFKYFNLNNKYYYKLINIPPNLFYKNFKNLNQFYGVNITTPYKITTLKKLNFNSHTAKFFGCVNTIKKLPNGQLKGFCTDHIGFLNSLKQLNQSKFKNVIILGFGGAGQMAMRCIQNKCDNLFIIVRNLNKINTTIQTNLSKQLNCNIQFLKNNNVPKLNFDLIINATTCGNYYSKNQTPINLNNIGKINNVFDLIYYPTQTILLKQAKKLKARTLNGTEMLIWQALAAQKIWNNFKFSNKFIQNLIKQTHLFLNNLSLHNQ